MKDNLSAVRLDATFFTENRKRLHEKMKVPYLIIIGAGRPPRKTADEDYAFLANRNFYYLTGIEQENAILLMIGRQDQYQEIIFVPEKDAERERWTGRMLACEDARQYSGCQDIRYTDDFTDLAEASMRETPVWLDLSAENPQAEELRRWSAGRIGDSGLNDVSPWLIQLRMIKQPEEIEAMRLAIAITGEGISAAREAARPGQREYHVWHAFRSELASYGLLETAFPSITAAGENSLCLHHMKPYGLIAPGNLVQLDVGASVAGLCADISRVLPADGYFSEKQKAIYDLVRQCQETAFRMIAPGVCLSDINRDCQETARKGLIELGLLQEQQSVKDYFWHSVSHHLGFDVHDPSQRELPLQPGMVITVEPGLYVEQWQIGIRLEDDVLVTESGCENLSLDLPREWRDFECSQATTD